MDILQLLVAVNYFLQFIISYQYGASLYLLIAGDGLNGVKRAMIMTFASRFVHQLYYLIVFFLIYSLFDMVVVTDVIYGLGIIAMSISTIMRIATVTSNSVLYFAVRNHVGEKRGKSDGSK